MEVQLNHRISSDPCITTQNEFSLPTLRAQSTQAFQPVASVITDQDTTVPDFSFNERSTSGGSQENEDLLKQTISLFNTFENTEDIMQSSLVVSVENPALLSTMRVVPLDIETLKESISYYQKKLYQRFSVKLNDLVPLEILGKGAFGEVRRAFSKTDRQFYALKELKRENFKKSIYFETAIWTEVQNLLKVAELNDPLLLETALIDFDEEQDRCYILMELGYGTLEEYAECMKKYGLSWNEKELEFILSQLVSQILKLKEVGMYHRDIKPGNVIISIKQDMLKLSDLGCSSITKEGVQKLNITGTPHFMSPELIQAIMKREMIVEHDPLLSDLYSLGITIVTLLNPSLKRKDLKNYLETEVKEHYPKLYHILEDLLGSPEKRKDAVEKVLCMDLSIRSYSQFVEQSLGERYKTHLYLKVICKNKDLNTSLYFDMFILDDALQVINKRISMLMEDKKPDDMNLEEVLWRIRLARCYYLQMNYEEALNELLNVMHRKELRSFDVANVLTKARALLWLGIVKVKLGRMEDAIDNLMHCLGIRVAEFGEVHKDVSAVFWYLGDTYFYQENFSAAVKAFEKCVEIGEKLDPKERKYMARALNNLGSMAELKEDHEKALECFERAKETAIAAYGEHHPAVANQFLSMAYTYVAVGKTKEGLALCDRALEIKIKWYGESNPEVADAFTKIAKVYERLGQYGSAIEYLYKSAEIWKKVNGEESQELADIYKLIGTIFCRKGQYRKSLDYANKVISIKEKYLGPRNPRIAATYVWHAETCHALGLFNEKTKSLEQFIAIDFNNLELNIESVLTGFRAARLLGEEKKIEKAWEYIQKSYEMATNLAISKIPKVHAFYCGVIASLRRAEGKLDLALNNVIEAVSERDHIVCKDYDIGAVLQSLVGTVYEDLGRNEEALEWRKINIDMIEKYLCKGTLLMLKAVLELTSVLVKLEKNEEAREKCHDAKVLIEKLRVSEHHPLVKTYSQLAAKLEDRQNRREEAEKGS